MILIIGLNQLQAQQQDNIYPKDLDNQPNDHFIIQYGGLAWMNKPDSIRTKFSSRSFNAYFMWNIPFKSSPKFSAAIGLGLGSDNMFFDKTQPIINGKTSTLQFPNVSNTNHFKKFKLVTSYIEIPVELRFVSNTKNINRAFKVAIGAKAGLLIDAHTKGKTLENASGNVLNTYVEKTKSNYYFNTTRFCGSFRIGYGPLSLFATYQLSQFFKDGVGADVKPLTIGLTLSGL